MKKVFLLGIPLLVLIVVFALVVGRKTPTETSGPVTPSSSVQPDVTAVKTGMEAVEPSIPTTAESAPKPVLSDLVSTILSDDASYRDRANAINGLGRNLSDEDVAALREFLLVSANDHEMRPISLNSLKNDVLEVLVGQDELPEGLGKQVVDMFNDPEADYMWKEYCLQFMEPLLKKTAESVEHGAGSKGQDAVRETLFAALDERDEDLAGTALLGLTRLARDGRDVDNEAVTAKAIEIAGDNNASDRCRLTAMRVAASAGNADVLPIARNLAQNARTDLLKAAAITTLGDFADPQDKDLLAQLSTTPNRQISSAARTALAKHSER